MSARFAVGAIVGALAALSGLLTPAVVVVGAVGLLLYGLAAPSDSATAGVVWVSAWAVVFLAITCLLVVYVLVLWFAPLATLFMTGILLTAGALQWRMDRTRGESGGVV